jgi:uncharacterized protein
MMTYNYPDLHLPAFIDSDSRNVLGAVLRRVYAWMTLGLFITAGTAAFISTSPLFQVLNGQPFIFYGLLIAEVGLVIGLSWGIRRLSMTTAVSLFLIYAALNGLTLSTLFMVYTLGSVAFTFLACAVTFGAMSMIGYTTKIDLSRMGSFLLMGIIGLVIAMLVNMFWANSTLGWIVTFAGIFLFLGLTIFDTQRIKRMTAAALQQGDVDVEAHLGILGALSLYLDFINLFLFLLRLGGRRR